MDYELMMNGNVKIGQKAPDFEAISTYGKIDFNSYKGKWIVLFSHPGDFTPVCTTEMIAFTRAHCFFKKMNTELLGLSIDSINSHLAWMYDIYARTGIKISFPIIADSNGEIARKYGMISNDISNNKTVRNVYIIDDKGIIRTILIYPMNIGRFIPEIIRIIQALQTSYENECMIPANWLPNKTLLNHSPNNYQELEKTIEDINERQNGLNWYLTYKK